MTSIRRRRLRWPLLAACASALVSVPLAGAGHDTTTPYNPATVMHLNVVNNQNPTGVTVRDCNVTDTYKPACFRAFNYHADGVGLDGTHGAATGAAAGVVGETLSSSANATGVFGIVTSSAAGTESAGVRGVNNGADINGAGVRGHQNGAGAGVYGTAPAGMGVLGTHTNLTGTAAGVTGSTNSTEAGAVGVFGSLAANSAGSSGVWGHNFTTGAFGIGVRGGHSGSGNGIYGSVAMSNVGAAAVLGQVLGTGGGGVALHGHHNGSGYGVYGNTTGAGAGVVGNQSAPAGWAGFFFGRGHFTGTLTKGGGGFKIDHPLDPAGKYLQHSFVESPDMKNVYDGVVRTDRRGFATVRLPAYFQALNRDFRYQLTSLSGLMDVAVVKEIANNRFTIQSAKPLAKVSWQVTGIRKDRWANANRIPVEEAKAASERGAYLNPELYGASKASSVLRTPPAPRAPAPAHAPRLPR